MLICYRIIIILINIFCWLIFTHIIYNPNHLPQVLTKNIEQHDKQEYTPSVQ